MAEIMMASTRCISCGSEDAPHPGELATTRVAEGVVRDERVRRCTPCHLARPRYVPEQLPSGQWVIRDHRHDTMLLDHADSSPRLYASRDDAQADLTELVARGAL